MIFIDRSLLTFNLVSRLSQVIKSSDNSDINASKIIIQRLLDSCPCLRLQNGNKQLFSTLSTLEQSTITLLLDLATNHEIIRNKIFQPFLDVLLTVESNTSIWCEKFESDFGKCFLLQLLKCDYLINNTSNNTIKNDTKHNGTNSGGLVIESGKVAAGIVAQLEAIMSKIVTLSDVNTSISTTNSTNSNGSTGSVVILQGIFETIQISPQSFYMHFRSILDVAQQIIRYVMLEDKRTECVNMYFNM